MGKSDHNTITEAANKLLYVNRSQILTTEFFLSGKTLAF